MGGRSTVATGPVVMSAASTIMRVDASPSRLWARKRRNPPSSCPWRVSSGTKVMSSATQPSSIGRISLCPLLRSCLTRASKRGMPVPASEAVEILRLYPNCTSFPRNSGFTAGKSQGKSHSFLDSRTRPHALVSIRHLWRKAVSEGSCSAKTPFSLRVAIPKAAVSMSLCA